MASTIKVRIKPGGKVEIKVEGVKGTSCSDLTKDLEKALGITIEDKKTSEFYQQINTQQVSQYDN